LGGGGVEVRIKNEELRRGRGWGVEVRIKNEELRRGKGLLC
jgi:hypothetical protein